MILPIFSQKQSSRLLHFSTRHCSRFFFLYMYLSLDPFTQLSIYIYRSSFPLPSPMSLSPFQSQCITALASNTNSTFHSHRCTTTTAVQLQVCIYEISYSAAVNNRLHVLFLMWGYFFYGKTTILRVRFRQLYPTWPPRENVYLLPANHALSTSVRNVLI